MMLCDYYFLQNSVYLLLFYSELIHKVKNLKLGLTSRTGNTSVATS